MSLIVRSHQGRLMGRMEALGCTLRSEAILKNLTLDVVKSSQIEGEFLDPEKVRSSIARKLGIDVGGLVFSDWYIDGVVEMMLDATQSFDAKLTKDRLLGWNASMFPAGRSGMYKIKTGAFRDDKRGLMRVVSGAMGREKIHFEAPAAKRLNREMKVFLEWFNLSHLSKAKKTLNMDAVIKAAIAHLWFVTIHPFDDGNGRIARAISDMQLARSDGSSERFYSMSSQIQKERNAYYDILEKTQKNINAIQDGIDITLWVEWFLNCLNRSFDMMETNLSDVLKKAAFWDKYSSAIINERQRLIINMLFDGFEGKLKTSKWAKITKCSPDTALRDIADLIDKGILVKDPGGGRSTSYSLAD